MLLRTVKESDARQLVELYNNYIRHTTITFETVPLSETVLIQRIREVTAFYPWIVLEEDNRLLGYAYLSSFNPRQAYQWTADLSLYLHFQHRYHGLGTILLEKIEALAKQQGLINLVSLITQDNTASCRFHQKHGFQQVGQLDTIGYKQRWLGLCLYLKRIQAISETAVPPQPFQPDTMLPEKR